MKLRRFSTALLALAMAAAAAPASRAAHRSFARTSAAQPEGYVSEVTNKFFPLQPGTTQHCERTTDGVPSSDDFIDTRQTQLILGVRCTVDRHLAYLGGIRAEDPFDFCAHDTRCNVWDFGEDTKELDAAGTVISTEG